MLNNKIKLILIVLFVQSLNIQYSNSQVRLPQLIRDSMILQRDTRIKLWGWAKPGEKIKISFLHKVFRTIAKSDSTWSQDIDPTKAGGPYTLTIDAKNHIIINNVLFGDVWLCSGQSNMVHQLALHKDTYAAEIAKANFPEIRHFWISTKPDLQNKHKDLTVSYWKWANPEDVLDFSAVAYFFAKSIYSKYHIPIGLINASVGGSPIEAWTSEEGLKEFPRIIATVEKNKDTSYVNAINRRSASSNINNGNLQKDKGISEPVKWFDVEYKAKEWHTINIPGYWEDQGIKGLHGIVWYRREIDVPPSMTDIPAKIRLGRIVDADVLYINGKQIANTTYQYPQRRYEIPANILKPGKNIIVIRVTNFSGKGGFVPDKPYVIEAGGQSIDLKGYWMYKVGEVFNRTVTFSGIQQQNEPTALFNGMIAPIINYRIKGILWYQGESNTGNANEYNKLLPSLIKDWRNQWENAKLPFLYVQLPNFLDVQYSPSESNWALLREAQLNALTIPNTAMAVAIDLGEWNDVHPEKKKEVGDRLALAAEQLVYGENIVYSGPIFKSDTIEGNKIRIDFTNTGSGLTTNDGGELEQFAIAREDKKFVWANATIDGNAVIVWSEEVPDPKYVRYAWADNPDGANLYNKEGLPASPFRTDH